MPAMGQSISRDILLGRAGEGVTPPPLQFAFAESVHASEYYFESSVNQKP
jgi:hypothetical protein